MKTRILSIAVLCLCALAASALAQDGGNAVQNATYPVTYINTDVFWVYYNIADPGPAKPKSIELWVTTDKGANWKQVQDVKFEISKDNENYFEFAAPADGEYGFKVAVIDETDNTDKRPVNGEYPQKAVIVDTAVPTMNLINPEQGMTVAGGQQLTVTWECQDKNMGVNNVLVEASFDGAKSWITVKGNLPPSGMITYQVPDAQLPNLIFRVSTYDLARNYAEYTMPLGVKVIASSPQATVPVKPPALVEQPTPAPTDFQTINSRSLKIDYTYEGESIAAVREICLFYTRDDGRTWERYGIDPDRFPPFEFVAPNDGKFGFYICAYNSTGLPNKPEPATGIRPELVVVVDTVAPVVCLISPQGGELWQANAPQIINWVAADKMGLSQNCISLFQSADGKRWTEIVKDVPNTGEWEWFSPEMNGLLFMKITARDSAGNTSEYSLKDPVIVQSKMPSVSIKSVSAADNEQKPPRIAVSPVPTVRKGDTPAAEQLFVRGSFFRKQERLEMARDAFVQAIDADPSYIDAYNELGVVLMGLNKPSEAAGILRKARDIDPTRPDILFNLAFALNETRESADAAGALLDMMKTCKPNSELASKGAALLWNLSLGLEGQARLDAWTAIANAPVTDNPYAARAKEKLAGNK